jgi:hypothetical protein
VWHTQDQQSTIKDPNIGQFCWGRKPIVLKILRSSLNAGKWLMSMDLFSFLGH